MYDIGSVIF